MLGDPSFFPDVILADASTVLLPPASDELVSSFVLSGGGAALPPHDTWGALTVPTTADVPGAGGGDQAISVILSFLKAFLTTDLNATVAWQEVFQTSPPIAAVFAHDPAQVAFNIANLPALYMWRESATQERAAEDWYRETTQVRALWVFPLSLPDNQRFRMAFVNALVKTIAVAIERGRTPSWVYPGDPDRNAPVLGSLFYTPAGFESFNFKSWKRAILSVEETGGGRDAFPAIEMTFLMEENLQYGQDNFAPLDVAFGGYLTIANESGRVVDDGPL